MAILDDVTIILAAPYWTLGGVNTYSENLVREFRQRGLNARILLTEESTHLIQVLEPAQPFPDDIPFDRLPVHKLATWGAHWGAQIKYLEDHAPCIYIPNGDWRHSCVSPRLSNDVAVVGVAHADEELHYDHVDRLGSTWNAVVTVNSIITRNLQTRHPDFADRISTISIGVKTPPEFPEKTWPDAERPLKIISVGRLIRYQKRIFDVLRIMEALDQHDLNIELTVVGSGDDQQQFIDEAAPLIEKGTVTLTGMVPFHDIPALLLDHHIFLLTSEFEGLPNALLEAMAHGCIPVISDIPGDVGELVRSGENGFKVPIGDIAAFVDALREIHASSHGQEALSRQAWETVRNEGYRIEDMASRYLQVFDGVLKDLDQGNFVRNPAPMNSPPYHVGDIPIFPVDDLIEIPDVGSFPSENDFHDFKSALAGASSTKAIYTHPANGENNKPKRFSGRHRNPTVVIGATNWFFNGVNHFCETLARGLSRKGWDARILLTEDHTQLVDLPGERMPYPDDIRLDPLPFGRRDSWGGHWGSMIRYLEQAAPCIYLPNFDWRHSSVGPLLSPEVKTVGIVFDWDEVYCDHINRLGAYWDAILALDRIPAQYRDVVRPELQDRVMLMSYGIEMPS
ncbi:MAG: glycosyltransferase family 4 protein, partial [Verrucomicrobiota bacterium]